MARGRKSIRRARRTLVANKHAEVIEGIAPDMRIAIDQHTAYGHEPKFLSQPEPERLNWELGKALNWYNAICAKKNAKPFILEYLTHNGKKVEAKLIKSVPDTKFDTSVSYLARLTMRGYVPTQFHQECINKEIDRLIGLATPQPEEEVKEVSNRPNVQEIMRERATEAAGEFEGWLDDFISKGAKSTFTVKVVDELTKRSVLQQHVNPIIDAWTKYKTEFNEVIKGKDEQLVEAYSRFTNTQLKNIVKFIDQIIGDLNSYISLKKTARKPRAKKAVPVEKQVAKLKYMKSFKNAEAKLDLVSLHPTKLHGASEAWVYDTQRRKLHHYVADDLIRVFTVKGNALLGFCAIQSEIKTLRKPAEQLKEIMGSKPVARKFFKDIKSVSVKPTGRFNENLIILKAF